MHLRGVDFGPVWGASGVQGFFGEGHPFHDYLGPFGLPDFSGMTFVAETMTLTPRMDPRADPPRGNMELDRETYRTKKLFPDCVVVRFWNGAVLNAVGLSNPGAHALFAKGLWQRRREPFFLSFVSDKEGREGRERELFEFIKLFCGHLRFFRAPVGLQLNFSCPNIGAHFDEFMDEVWSALTIADTAGVPLVPKFNVLLTPEAACMTAEHRACDAICISNTIPWGSLPDKIPWKKLFGSSVSPLARYGGGGLSGKPLLPLVARWVNDARHRLDIRKPINAGGGILSPDDAVRLFVNGASSVFLGSIAMLRPWLVQPTISAVRGYSTVG